MEMTGVVAITRHFKYSDSYPLPSPLPLPQCDYNQQQRQTLYSLAIVEMKRQEVRQQANEVSHCSIEQCPVGVIIPATDGFHY